MKRLWIPFFFSFGIFMLTLGMLFRTMHWFGGSYFYTTGLALDLVAFILILAEIFLSQKAAKTVKTMWSLPFILLPLFITISIRYSPASPGFMYFILLAIFVLGLSYLAMGRQRFVSSNRRKSIEFDSIDV